MIRNLYFVNKIKINKSIIRNSHFVVKVCTLIILLEVIASHSQNLSFKIKFNNIFPCEFPPIINKHTEII